MTIGSILLDRAADPLIGYGGRHLLVPVRWVQTRSFPNLRKEPPLRCPNIPPVLLKNQKTKEWSVSPLTVRRIRGRRGQLGGFEVEDVGTVVLGFGFGCGACWIHPWRVSYGIGGKVGRR